MAVITISVKLGEPLGQKLGARKIALSLPPGATVAQALEALEERYPSFRDLFYEDGPVPLYNLFLNGRLVRPEQAGEVVLKDGDKLYLFLPVAGGGDGPFRGQGFAGFYFTVTPSKPSGTT